VPADYIHGSLRLSFGDEPAPEDVRGVVVPALLRTVRAVTVADGSTDRFGR
jgi:hypothetical protein